MYKHTHIYRREKKLKGNSSESIKCVCANIKKSALSRTVHTQTTKVVLAAEWKNFFFILFYIYYFFIRCCVEMCIKFIIVSFLLLCQAFQVLFFFCYFSFHYHSLLWKYILFIYYSGFYFKVCMYKAHLTND